MKLIAYFFLYVLLVFSFAAHAAETDPPSPTKSTFLVIYRPGPSWVQGKPVNEQPLKGHGTYMLDLYARGAMTYAGSFADNTGGALVLTVADEAEARAIVATDPAVTNGVLVPEIHPWRQVPWAEHLAKRASKAP
jgi:uncharacterized protein YciI